jgi:type IV pilus assembly protein PilV
MRSHSLKKKTSGYSLIEVLVALFVLALGVLGAAALQMNALKFNQTASLRTQATFLAYEIVDRMRANRAAARDGDYVQAMNAAKPTGAGVVQGDIAAWITAIENQLPAGDGAVTQNGDLFTITVQWSEARIGGSDTQQFIFETEL